MDKLSQVPNSLTHLALLTVLTDTKPTGLFGALFPFFKWLAKKARNNGTERLLLENTNNFLID
jgi:hypothetical protein